MLRQEDGHWLADSYADIHTWDVIADEVWKPGVRRIGISKTGSGMAEYRLVYMKATQLDCETARTSRLIDGTLDRALDNCERVLENSMQYHMERIKEKHFPKRKIALLYREIHLSGTCVKELQWKLMDRCPVGVTELVFLRNWHLKVSAPLRVALSIVV